MKNLFSECWRYWNRSLRPVLFPIHFCILYMIQCAEYVLSPDFISTFKKIDFNESEIVWNLAHNPSEATLDMIYAVIFNSASINRRQRYYVPSYETPLPDDVPPLPLPQHPNLKVSITFLLTEECLTHFFFQHPTKHVYT